MRAGASSAVAKVTKTKNCPIKNGGSGGGKWSRLSRGWTERAQVVETRTEGQGGQSNEQEEKNDDAPGLAPAYDPASVIDHMKTTEVTWSGKSLDVAHRE